MKHILLLIGCCFATSLFPQDNYVSQVWAADLGNGSYKNPVLHADYSDPDAIRVGDDFYMTASSFDAVPGLPILHSKDLVNWRIIGHALKRQVPVEYYSKTQHGNGVWAPAIRYHNNEFYIYYPDPDFGIYMVKSKAPEVGWSEPVLVEGGKGLIDPCPLWDGDGKNYLVHAYAGSRAGIKSVLVIKRLSEDGSRVIDEGKIIYDGHEIDPTIEGPKFYKRNGYYYIFAPAGGVSTGWQLALRSKNIYGPYERKIIMDRGSTSINGPHQGAWVNTASGEDWFLHFQDKEVYGRVVHLQPMTWKNDWPITGFDKDGDGKGEPVSTYKKPDVGKFPIHTPAESDEFNSGKLGLQWQWQANPKSTWYFLNESTGSLRLYSQMELPEARNLWEVPNLLMQKFPSEEFTVITKMVFHPNTKLEGEKAGLLVMGQSYAHLSLKSTKTGTQLVYAVAKGADAGNAEEEIIISPAKKQEIVLRITVAKGGMCTFSYSWDGEKYESINDTFQAKAGKWIGAKIGLYCTRSSQTNDSGYVDIDWFRVMK
ncbi:glycoside hydrolase [Cytophagales bacterium WSM2-2]|nr:glycoside hydrolase [Cytophagales bacterium WSM2-2]